MIKLVRFRHKNNLVTFRETLWVKMLTLLRLGELLQLLRHGYNSNRGYSYGTIVVILKKTTMAKMGNEPQSPVFRSNVLLIHTSNPYIITTAEHKHLSFGALWD